MAQHPSVIKENSDEYLALLEKAERTYQALLDSGWGHLLASDDAEGREAIKAKLDGLAKQKAKVQEKQEEERRKRNQRVAEMYRLKPKPKT